MCLLFCIDHYGDNITIHMSMRIFDIIILFYEKRTASISVVTCICIIVLLQIFVYTNNRDTGVCASLNYYILHLTLAKRRIQSDSSKSVILIIVFYYYYTCILIHVPIPSLCLWMQYYCYKYTLHTYIHSKARDVL